MIGRLKRWLLFPKSPWKLATLLIPPLFMALGALTFTLVRWEKKSLDEIQVSGLVEVGRIFYQHIMSTRIWSSGHGGMYIESMEDVSPGPTDRDPGLHAPENVLCEISEACEFQPEPRPPRRVFSPRPQAPSSPTTSSPRRPPTPPRR